MRIVLEAELRLRWAILAPHLISQFFSNLARRKTARLLGRADLVLAGFGIQDARVVVGTRARLVDGDAADDDFRIFVGLVTLTCFVTLAVAVSLSLSLI